eukprot:RCo006713
MSAGFSICVTFQTLYALVCHTCVPAPSLKGIISALFFAVTHVRTRAQVLYFIPSCDVARHSPSHGLFLVLDLVHKTLFLDSISSFIIPEWKPFALTSDPPFSCVKSTLGGFFVFMQLAFNV